MAQFGAFYVNTNCKIPKEVVLAYPIDACSPLQNHSTYVDESNSENHYKDKLVLVTRGQCAFIQKALYVEQAGAAGMIVVNSENGEMHLMSDDGTDAGNLIRIPCVLIPYDRGQQIMYYMELRNQEIEREKQREVKMQNVPTSPNMDNLFSSIWIRPKVTAALGYCSTLDFHFF
ncbi:hypothetical protein C9374_000217 [Naegleria lovaniensis]|uniref:PA domain-containing protein n=1 Tax=Naegleria lovaniensis TaxID=51637 RepID=A0AA88KNU9_NAELO|nr:uncharacterized protein C9374_000217 [Naegleria lovaniensis]KAG2388778.1 hypothetical protein C9374_000217 [Naegleria lovaniensis]